jgi:hypothetical protein
MASVSEAIHGHKGSLDCSSLTLAMTTGFTLSHPEQTFAGGH